MSDENITQEEIQEAMSLLSGDSVTIEPARKRIVRRGGRMVETEEPAYVKFYTDFKNEIGDIDGNTVKVFIYIGLSIGFNTGSAYPGLRKIAKATKLDKDTVARAVAELESKGFLEVVKREGSSNVYTPIGYIAIGRTVPTEGTVDDELSENDDELSPSDAKLSPRGRVDLHNKINKKEPELPLVGLTEEEYEQANHKVDMILALNKKGIGMWKGRESFNDNVLHYADWYFNSTGQIPTAKTKKSWIKAFSDWKDDELGIEDLEEARRTRIGWKKFIADPNELTKDASAIKAQKSIAPEAKTNNGTGFYA